MALHYHRPMVVTNVGGLSEGLKMPIAKIVKPFASNIANGLANVLKLEQPSKNEFTPYLKQRSWKSFAKKIITFAQSL